MTREELLARANECVNGEREKSYGSPERNFQIISQLWTDYLGVSIEPTDVAIMMILLKIARVSSGKQTIDSWVDIAGYAACGGELSTEKQDS